ncbi:hypothetical protein DFH07DRAFT_232694 [Mycena maculata]|uniref:Uncharacterized protein n=1 Tax=Mycena maculata TaxID=230809 RepID=A0AAD7HSF1_9AGAR|nr:hypothetical protein DFH07DRAFT_232694 [Mycena maculata]
MRMKRRVYLCSVRTSACAMTGRYGLGGTTHFLCTRRAFRTALHLCEPSPGTPGYVKSSESWPWTGRSPSPYTFMTLPSSMQAFLPGALLMRRLLDTYSPDSKTQSLESASKIRRAPKTTLCRLHDSPRIRSIGLRRQLKIRSNPNATRQIVCHHAVRRVHCLRSFSCLHRPPSRHPPHLRQPRYYTIFLRQTFRSEELKRLHMWTVGIPI